jgi:putative hemolysin
MMKAAILVGVLGLLLAACAGPSLEAFNDRGGVISYHMVNSNMADVLAVAERYCAGQGRKARLGTANETLPLPYVPRDDAPLPSAKS